MFLIYCARSAFVTFLQRIGSMKLFFSEKKALGHMIIEDYECEHTGDPNSTNHKICKNTVSGGTRTHNLRIPASPLEVRRAIHCATETMKCLAIYRHLN